MNKEEIMEATIKLSRKLTIFHILQEFPKLARLEIAQSCQMTC